MGQYKGCAAARNAREWQLSGLLEVRLSPVVNKSSRPQTELRSVPLAKAHD